jgi:hypothetical protein
VKLFLSCSALCSDSIEIYNNTNILEFLKQFVCDAPPWEMLLEKFGGKEGLETAFGESEVNVHGETQEEDSEADRHREVDRQRRDACELLFKGKFTKAKLSKSR